MKKIIFRKPKFMRDENKANVHLKFSKIYAGFAESPFDEDDADESRKISKEEFKMAAKLGGFLSQRGLREYLKTHEVIH